MKTNTGQPTEYSDSVNAMNGCLGYIGQVMGYFFMFLSIILVGPWVLLILLVWWIIAWILGLLFPGKEFFPIKRIYRRFAPWFERTFGISLGEAAIGSILIVIASAFIGGISKLSSRGEKD